MSGQHPAEVLLSELIDAVDEMEYAVSGNASTEIIRQHMDRYEAAIKAGRTYLVRRGAQDETSASN